MVSVTLCSISVVSIRYSVPTKIPCASFLLCNSCYCNIIRAVTVPLIPFPVRFCSVFQQKPQFRFGSVFCYLLTFFGHFKSRKHKRC